MAQSYVCSISDIQCLDPFFSLHSVDQQTGSIRESSQAATTVWTPEITIGRM